MKKFNILIVDDELEMRNLLNEILSDLGHNIFSSDNAHKALSILNANEIDILILDNQMPEKSGEELLRDIEKIIDHKFKIIFTTGTNRNLLQLVEENNIYHLVDYVLNKPYTIKNIKSAIEEVI